jgi:hypothetical protein
MYLNGWPLEYRLVAFVADLKDFSCPVGLLSIDDYWCFLIQAIDVSVLTRVYWLGNGFSFMILMYLNGLTAWLSSCRFWGWLQDLVLVQSGPSYVDGSVFLDPSYWWICLAQSVLAWEWNVFEWLTCLTIRLRVDRKTCFLSSRPFVCWWPVFLDPSYWWICLAQSVLAWEWISQATGKIFFSGLQDKYFWGACNEWGMWDYLLIAKPVAISHLGIHFDCC